MRAECKEEKIGDSKISLDPLIFLISEVFIGIKTEKLIIQKHASRLRASIRSYIVVIFKVTESNCITSDKIKYFTIHKKKEQKQNKPNLPVGERDLCDIGIGWVSV